MVNRPTSIQARVSNKIGFGLILFCLIFFSLTVYSLIVEDNKFQKRVRQQVKVQTIEAAARIGDKLSEVVSRVEEFRGEVESVTNKKDLAELLPRRFEEWQELSTLNITFKPYLYDRYTRYFSPYYERFSGETKIFNLLDYDKPDKQFNWYHRPLKEGGIWTEPYYERENAVLMTTYSVPFSLPQDNAAGHEYSGVIPSDVSLEYLTTALQRLDLGLGGYGMVFSKEMQLVAHPVFSYVKEQPDIEKLKQDPEFAFIEKIQSCFKDETKYLFFNGEVMDNDEHYAACVKIPQTGWTLITRMSSDMFEQDQTKIRQGYIQAIGWFAAAILIFVLVIYDSIRTGISKRNASVSAVLFISTLLILGLAKNLSYDYDATGTTITNAAQRAAFIKNYQMLSEKIHSADPVFVPTGLFIQSIEFVNAHNVHITGNVWQKFDRNQLNYSDIGVNFPLAVKKSVKELYRRTNDRGELVVGYEFDITLRQQFDYSKYPFDSKNIGLQLEHASVGENVMLIPDLESFEKLGKKDNSAILDQVVLEEWQLNQSFYNYTYKHNKTSYGVENHRALNEPVMTYTIHLEREFISPFVTALLPVMVMVCLLYACIVSMPHTEYGELRNNITAVIFTILLAHYSIREHLQIDEVIYLEMFYFLLYIQASLFLYLSHQFNISKENAKRNKLYRVLALDWYWPTLTSMVLFITVITYY